MFESLEKFIANIKSTSHTAFLILQDINAEVSNWCGLNKTQLVNDKVVPEVSAQYKTPVKVSENVTSAAYR